MYKYDSFLIKMTIKADYKNMLHIERSKGIPEKIQTRTDQITQVNSQQHAPINFFADFFFF